MTVCKRCGAELGSDCTHFMRVMAPMIQIDVPLCSACWEDLVVFIEAPQLTSEVP